LPGRKAAVRFCCLNQNLRRFLSLLRKGAYED
jgi:hypothetical protein